tara:strand:- start:3047 stop:3694 length:648 start_codon:yes stop_codon:yes gene_type:complete
MNNRKSNKMKNKRRSNRMKNKRRSNRLKVNKRSKRSKISRKSTRSKKTKMNKRNYKKRTIRRRRRSQRGGAPEDNLFVVYPDTPGYYYSHLHPDPEKRAQPVPGKGPREQSKYYPMKSTTWNQLINDIVVNIRQSKLGLGEKGKDSLTILVRDDKRKKNLVKEIEKFLNGKSMDTMISDWGPNVGEALVNAGLASEIDGTMKDKVKYFLHTISRV